MADRPTQLLLQCLSRAAAEAGTVPLLAGRSTPGIFPATTAGKQLAQRCCDQGFLVEQAGSYSLTDKGRSFLLENLSLREVLEDFVRALEAREAQSEQLIAQVRELQGVFNAMRREVGPVLDMVRRLGTANSRFAEFHQSPAPTPEIHIAIVAALQQWMKAPGATKDCPLPELYRQCRATSIGAFHDTLRVLRAENLIVLHPWTAPLYAIPEPGYAMLDGHIVAYYASLRL